MIPILNRSYMLNNFIRLFWNKFKIISVFYFKPNYTWNWNKLFQSLKEFWNYFKIISAILNMLENIDDLQ